MSTGATTDLPLRPRAAAALQRLKSSAGQAEALEAVGEIVSQLIGCEEYVVLALNATRTDFSPLAAAGLPMERLQVLASLQGLLGQVARGGVPYLVGRTSAAGASSHEAGLTACIPLMAEGRIGGVLALFRLLPQKRGLDEEDLSVLQILSAHGGAGLTVGASSAILPPAPPTAPLTPPPVSEVRAIYLHPGDIFASGNPVEVTTILGSCVAVCLWDPHLRCGGVNHFLLPRAPAGHAASIRHGDVAIPALLAEMRRLGSQPSRLQAKVFGGAAMGVTRQGEGLGLGERNARLARSVLAELGISLVAEDLGGEVGRKLRFRTDDGTALIQMLRNG